MTTCETVRDAFRCTVVSEISAGRLTIGWHTYKVRLLDTSRDAFTLEVDSKKFGRIKEGSKALLETNGEKWEVRCTAIFHMLDGQLNLSMARVKERLRAPVSRTTFWSLLPIPSPTADPVLPLALLLSFLFACIALPGMGDTLGTAPKIRKAVQDVWRKTLGDR